MKLLVFLLLIFSTCCSNSGVLAFDELELDYNDNFQYIPEYQSQARFLNVSFDDIFNNSLLTLGGIFVIGVILFGKAITYLLKVIINKDYYIQIMGPIFYLFKGRLLSKHKSRCCI